MLQCSTVEGLGWALHCSAGYRFLSRSEQITCRLREPDPQLLEHWRKMGSVITVESTENNSATKAAQCPCILCVFAALTRPHSPTCQLICLGQAAISQDRMAAGRNKALQDVSSSFIPPEPTQVTSLVCSPEPQVTEHCRHKSTEFNTDYTDLNFEAFEVILYDRISVKSN